MNISRVFIPAVSAFLVFGSAVAQEGTQDFQNRPLSSKTRAEVLTELEQARLAGKLELQGESYSGFTGNAIASTRSRAEVLVELDAAKRARALDTRNYSASYGSFRLGEIRSTRSRQEVRDELAIAQKLQLGLSRGERTGG